MVVVCVLPFFIGMPSAVGMYFVLSVDRVCELVRYVLLHMIDSNTLRAGTQDSKGHEPDAAPSPFFWRAPGPTSHNTYESCWQTHLDLPRTSEDANARKEDRPSAHVRTAPRRQVQHAAAWILVTPQKMWEHASPRFL